MVLWCSRLLPAPPPSLFPYTTLFRSLLEQQHAGLVLGRPVVRIVLERVAVNIVKDHLELIGELVPARVLRAGHADQSQVRSEEHTSELQSHHDLVCRLLLENNNPHAH